MPLITTGSGTPEDQIEAGSYPGALKAVGIKQIDVKSSKFGKTGLRSFFEWAFELDGTEDDEGNLYVVTGLTSDATGPKSTTFKYLSALLGDVEIGAEFDEQDLVGKRAIIVVGFNEAGYNRIDDVVAPAVAAPTRRRAAAGTAAPSTAPVPLVRPTVAEKVTEVESDGSGDEDDLPF